MQIFSSSKSSPANCRLTGEQSRKRAADFRRRSRTLAHRGRRHRQSRHARHRLPLSPPAVKAKRLHDFRRVISVLVALRRTSLFARYDRPAAKGRSLKRRRLWPVSLSAQRLSPARNRKFCRPPAGREIDSNLRFLNRSALGLRQSVPPPHYGLMGLTTRT